MEESIKQLEWHLLLNIPLTKAFDDKFDNFEKIFNGQYEDLLRNNFCLSTIVPLLNENIEDNIMANINLNKDNHEEWFCIGIASLMYFIQNNFTGTLKKEEINHFLLQRKTAFTKLSVHDLCNENISKPELLLLAKTILNSKDLHAAFPSSVWWSLRANYVHQLILDEGSGILFEELDRLIKLLLDSDILKDNILETLFYIEVTQIYLYYTRIQSSEKYLQDAMSVAKLSIALDGALGKRTKYQHVEKAQLRLKVNIDKEVFPYRTCESLPSSINLSDDLRLEKIEFSEKTENLKLGSIEEAIIMAKV